MDPIDNNGEIPAGCRPDLSLIHEENFAAAVIWDEKRNILDANKTLNEMLNYVPGECCGAQWDTLTAAECRESDQRRLADLARAGHAGPWRTVFLSRGGGRVPVVVQASRCRNGLYLGLILDAVEFEQGERELQRLAGKLLKLYDEERRRIARELHDTTAQNLAALSMNLTMLGSSARDPVRSSEIMQECASLTEECLKEVRSLSYMLHPPLLDELGLETALRTFITLYERRTGVSVELVSDGAVGRLAPEVELGVFRIAQESLFNVQRHSGSQKAQVLLKREDRRLEVVVRDWGKGIAPEAARGDSLGVAGMRERVRLLGGHLEIGPAGPGTLVRAVFPTEQ